MYEFFCCLAHSEQRTKGRMVPEMDGGFGSRASTCLQATLAMLQLHEGQEEKVTLTALNDTEY